MLRAALLMSALLPAGAGAGEAAPPATEAMIEFLWAMHAPDAIARQPTRGFVADGRQRHAVCVFALPAHARVQGLVIEGVDPTGTVAVRQVDAQFTGDKRCHVVSLEDGEPGRWTWRAYLDGRTQADGEATIEVAPTLEQATFYAPSPVPYVLGRPNYDASIPPEQFRGRLVWRIHVDRAGTVTGVEIEAAEGVGERMRDRAIAAGYLSRFAPDPDRPVDFSYRRELEFKPD